MPDSVRPVACPLCGTETEGRVVLVRPSRGPKTTDLRQFADGPDPLPEQLCSCPGCGYAGLVSDFEEHAPAPALVVPASAVGAFFSQEAWDDAHDPMLADRPRLRPSTLKEQVDTHLSARAAEAADDAPLRYEHHAHVQRWKGSGPLREGDAWLRAAWLHNDAGAAEADRRCRRRALHCYRQGIAERTWFRRREDLCVVAYLVGELHRRLGDPTEAGRWYEQAVAWSSGLQHMQDLVELAERQGRDPRELV